MVRTCPVMKEDASEQNSRTAPTRSSVSPTRLSGIRETILFLNSTSCSREATCGVSTKVGEMALTVMPYLAHSVAHCRVSALIAPFAAT
jgi:hypothetical protein